MLKGEDLLGSEVMGGELFRLAFLGGIIIQHAQYYKYGVGANGMMVTGWIRIDGDLSGGVWVCVS